MEFIVEFLMEVLFSYPGAGVRWLLHGGKIPYKVLLLEDFTYNAAAFTLTLFILAVSVWMIIAL